MRSGLARVEEEYGRDYRRAKIMDRAGRGVVWARCEGHSLEDTHGLIVSGYDQAMGEFRGCLEGVNDLGPTLAMENARTAFFPWASVARIVLAMQ